MRQDELDFIETLPATPVLDRRGPTMTGVTQAMDENDRGRVPGCCREEEGRLSNEGCHLVVCYLLVLSKKRTPDSLFVGASRVGTRWGGGCPP